MAGTSSCSVRVAAPPPTVHALVGDVARHPEWAADDLAVEHVAGPLRGPGSRWRSRVTDPYPGVPGVLEADLEVVAERPGELLVLEAADRSGRHRWTWRLVPVRGGTDVTVTVERHPAAGAPGRLEPLLWRACGRSALRRGLARLAVLATTEPPPLPRRIDLSAPDRPASRRR